MNPHVSWLGVMTERRGDTEAIWDNLLDSLKQYLEVQQDAPALPKSDEDPNYIWKPQRQDRDNPKK